ncbi:MAG TPA: hypothetical protein VGD53_28935 [Actinoallomurus sp.]
MTESADGTKPMIRGGVPLPKVTSAAGAELFSPDAVEAPDAVAVPQDDGDPLTLASTVARPLAGRTIPETPRHARRSRPKLGFIVAAVAALVAVPLVLLTALGGGDDRHGSSAQDRPSGAANPGVPAPDRPSAVPWPSATPMPGGTSGTPAVKPGEPSKQSSGDGGTTGGGTSSGGTSGGAASAPASAPASTPTSAPAGGWVGGPAGGAGRPGGGRRGGGPRGPGMGGGFR